MRKYLARLGRLIVVGTGALAACSGPTSTTSTIPQNVQSMHSRGTGQARQDAGKKADVTGTPTFDTYPVSQTGGTLILDAVTLGSYERDNAVWFTNVDASSPSVIVYDEATYTDHIFSVPSGLGVPTGIDELKGHVYVAMSGSATVLQYDENAPTNQPVPISTAVVNLGGIADNGGSVVWTNASNAFDNYNVSTGATDSFSTSLKCSTATTMAYALLSGVGSLLCPITKAATNALGIYDIASGTSTTVPFSDGSKPNANVVQASTGGGYEWVSDVQYGSGSQELAVFQLDSSANLVTTYAGLPAFMDSGAITAASGAYGVWVIAGSGIEFFLYCPAVKSLPASWTPYYIANYSDSETKPGGVVSSSDGTVWYLQNSPSVSLVHLYPNATYGCPQPGPSAARRAIIRKHHVRVEFDRPPLQ